MSLLILNQYNFIENKLIAALEQIRSTKKFIAAMDHIWLAQPFIQAELPEVKG